LKNNFVVWADEPAQQLLAELTKMVDPNLYDQLRGFLYEKQRKKGYVEKVKEIAEPKAEEQANVDNVGPF
jgi:hypothetical protein